MAAFKSGVSGIESLEDDRGIFIYGYSSVAEARASIKHMIRFLPPSDIEVWLTDAPGICITGEDISASRIAELIPGHCGCRELEPEGEGSAAPGKFLECIYSGVY